MTVSGSTVERDFGALRQLYGPTRRFRALSAGLLGSKGGAANGLHPSFISVGKLEDHNTLFEYDKYRPGARIAR
jgi:hypothetical protein